MSGQNTLARQEKLNKKDDILQKGLLAQDDFSRKFEQTRTTKRTYLCL
jgi:hypothetical protein